MLIATFIFHVRYFFFSVCSFLSLSAHPINVCFLGSSRGAGRFFPPGAVTITGSGFTFCIHRFIQNKPISIFSFFPGGGGGGGGGSVSQVFIKSK